MPDGLESEDRRVAIELTSDAQLQLEQLCAATTEDAGRLASEAVGRLHRSLIGYPITSPDAPKIDTGRFRKLYSLRPAEAVLREVDATNFDIEEPFRYLDAAGRTRWEVDAPADTDLASVPGFLTWLVPRYGRHTLAALLHDHLQDDVKQKHMTSAAADEVFRDAMAETGVPLLRRWMMWAAVSIRTRKNDGGIGMVAALLWVGVYAVMGGLGLPLLVLAVVAGGIGAGAALSLFALAVVSPFVLGALWGRGYRFAILTGGLTMLVGFAALVDLVVLGLYALLEFIVERFQKRPKPLKNEKLKETQPARPSQPDPRSSHWAPTDCIVWASCHRADDTTPKRSLRCQTEAVVVQLVIALVVAVAAVVVAVVIRSRTRMDRTDAGAVHGAVDGRPRRLRATRRALARRRVLVRDLLVV